MQILEGAQGVAAAARTTGPASALRRGGLVQPAGLQEDRVARAARGAGGYLTAVSPAGRRQLEGKAATPRYGGGRGRVGVFPAGSVPRTPGGRHLCPLPRGSPVSICVRSTWGSREGRLETARWGGAAERPDPCPAWPCSLALDNSATQNPEGDWRCAWEQWG